MEERRITSENLKPPSTERQLKEAVAFRMQLNLETTGHPLHHLTASGVVVDSDSTLLEWITHLPEASRPAIPEHRESLIPAVCENTNWYTTDEGVAFLLGWMGRQKEQ